MERWGLAAKPPDSEYLNLPHDRDVARKANTMSDRP